MVQHKTLAWTDDVKYCTRVEAARKSIYEKGYMINSEVVENLLQEHSLVPSAVFVSLFLKRFYADLLLSEHIFKQASAIRFQHVWKNDGASNTKGLTREVK
jgi:hypothetical protein